MYHIIYLLHRFQIEQTIFNKFEIFLVLSATSENLFHVVSQLWVYQLPYWWYPRQRTIGPPDRPPLSRPCQSPYQWPRSLPMETLPPQCPGSYLVRYTCPKFNKYTVNQIRNKKKYLQLVNLIWRNINTMPEINWERLLDHYFSTIKINEIYRVQVHM